jgi:hypothetical protein
MPITRASHPDLLWPGRHVPLRQLLRRVPPGVVADLRQAHLQEGLREDRRNLRLRPGPEKSEGAGDPVRHRRAGHRGQTFTHIVYGLGWMATREEIEDGQYVEVSGRRTKRPGPLHADHGRDRPRQRPEPGFSASYLGADAWRCAPRPTRPWPANLANKPTVDADLTESSLEDMLTLIAGGHRSPRPADPHPRMKLVVASGAQFNATRILNSTPALRHGEQRHQRGQGHGPARRPCGQPLPHRRRRLVRQTDATRACSRSGAARRDRQGQRLRHRERQGQGHHALRSAGA